MTELYTKKSKVVKLSPTDFEYGILNPNAIENKRVSFVMFFVNWCGHCQHAEPIWTKFAKIAPKDVAVCVVDCVKHSELGSNFGVHSYPTIKIFNQQGALLGDYTEARDVDSLNEFAKSLVSPPATPRSKIKTKAKTAKKKAPTKAKKASAAKKSVAKKKVTTPTKAKKVTDVKKPIAKKVTTPTKKKGKYTFMKGSNLPN